MTLRSWTLAPLLIVACAAYTPPNAHSCVRQRSHSVGSGVGRSWATRALVFDYFRLFSSNDGRDVEGDDYDDVDQEWQAYLKREQSRSSRSSPSPAPPSSGGGLQINQPRAGSSSGGGVPPEPFSRRREVIGGVDAGPAPLSRGGPVNDDARAREDALTESFTQTGFTVLTTTIGASLLFFLATGALGGITDGSDRFDTSGIEPITREAQAETQAADEARAARNRAASAIDGPVAPVAPDGDGRWVI